MQSSWITEHTFTSMKVRSLFSSYAARSHFVCVAGGLAYHSQATSITLVPSNGRYLRWTEDIQPAIVLNDDNIHSVPTKVIELENTLSGQIMPQEEVEKISREARKLGSEYLISINKSILIWNSHHAHGSSSASRLGVILSVA